MDFFEQANKDLDEHAIHYDGVVDNEECFKRRFLRCLACPVCSYVWTLRFMSCNKDMEEFQDVEGLYQTDQELEVYIKDHRDHIKKHRLIEVN